MRPKGLFIKKTIHPPRPLSQVFHRFPDFRYSSLEFTINRKSRKINEFRLMAHFVNCRIFDLELFETNRE